jgi:hypothetical protein
MATSEERMKILKMVRAEDGIRLIEALGQRQPPVPPPSPAPQAGAGRFIRIRVIDTRTGKARVNVRLPVNLINAGMKMGARMAPEVEGVDGQRIIQAIRDGETGKIVDVVHGKENEHVEVIIE